MHRRKEEERKRVDRTRNVPVGDIGLRHVHHCSYFEKQQSGLVHAAPVHVRNVPHTSDHIGSFTMSKPTDRTPTERHAQGRIAAFQAFGVSALPQSYAAYEHISVFCHTIFLRFLFR
ncbi:hypothetical protein [Dictyobacter aurantiacus]|uniref:hypothetical protein n=1 Tax=Dictyobacter aurantiacus TaxID=1936993 RepID=UPI000F840747|nr:hypothetical protein [Dictyobacter aurantiacus]